MVTLYVPLGGTEAIRAEIKSIDAKIKGVEDSVVFFSKQLYGAPAVMLFTQEQIDQNPSLKEEQKELFPAIIGAIQRDNAYRDFLFPALQSVVDTYEDERVGIDGQFGDFTIPGPPPPGAPGSGLFDENCVQVSGGNRILPLFDINVSAVEPLNPGQMFGGTALNPTNEIAEIVIELAQITILLSGACQVAPPIPVSPCQNAKTALLNSLKARYDSTIPSGILLGEEAALNANPDLAQFASDPLGELAAEKSRITAFITAINAVPMNTAIPPATLTANQTAATARQTYLTGTRIPEMGTFLNTTPGYYNQRFQTLRMRVAGSGTLQQVNFLQQSIADAAVEKAALLAERAFLVSLLPPM
jgi:hypothetical protein